MQCDLAQQFFSDYVTGTVDSALLVTLEHHLATCEGCRETVSELKSLWSTLDQMPVVEPSPNFHSALMERIYEQQNGLERPIVVPRKAWNWRRIFQPTVLAYAATAIILLTSVELVQIQRASLGPIGLIASLIARSPVVDDTAANWAPSGVAGGVLRVRFKVRPLANGAANRLHYRLKLLRATGEVETVGEGDCTSQQRVTATASLGNAPALSDHLQICVSAQDTPGENEQAYPIAIEQPR